MSEGARPAWSRVRCPNALPYSVAASEAALGAYLRALADMLHRELTCPPEELVVERFTLGA